MDEKNIKLWSDVFEVIGYVTIPALVIKSGQAQLTVVLVSGFTAVMDQLTIMFLNFK